MAFYIPHVQVSIGRESTGIKQWIASWAKSVGAEHTQMSQYGTGGGEPFGYGCANGVVFSAIKEALGLSVNHVLYY